VNRQKFFRGPQVEIPWSKRLKPSGAAYRTLEAKREKIDEICRVHICRLYKKADKMARVVMRKVPTSRKRS